MRQLWVDLLWFLYDNAFNAFVLAFWAGLVWAAMCLYEAALSRAAKGNPYERPASVRRVLPEVPAP